MSFKNLFSKRDKTKSNVVHVEEQKMFNNKLKKKKQEKVIKKS